jgi:hypothetical protein
MKLWLINSLYTRLLYGAVQAGNDLHAYIQTLGKPITADISVSSWIKT